MNQRDWDWWVAEGCEEGKRDRNWQKKTLVQHAKKNSFNRPPVIRVIHIDQQRSSDNSSLINNQKRANPLKPLRAYVNC